MSDERGEKGKKGQKSKPKRTKYRRHDKTTSTRDAQEYLNRAKRKRKKRARANLLRIECQGSLHIAFSPTIKKVQTFRRQADVYHVLLCMLPSKTNLDKNEPSWSKAKTNDSIEPALLVFPGKRKARDFCSGVQNEPVTSADFQTRLLDFAVGVVILTDCILSRNLDVGISELKKREKAEKVILGVEKARDLIDTANRDPAIQFQIVFKHTAHTFYTKTSGDCTRWVTNLDRLLHTPSAALIKIVDSTDSESSGAEMDDKKTAENSRSVMRDWKGDARRDRNLRRTSLSGTGPVEEEFAGKKPGRGKKKRGRVKKKAPLKKKKEAGDELLSRPSTGGKKEQTVSATKSAPGNGESDELLQRMASVKVITDNDSGTNTPAECLEVAQHELRWKSSVLLSPKSTLLESTSDESPNRRSVADSVQSGVANLNLSPPTGFGDAVATALEKVLDESEISANSKNPVLGQLLSIIRANPDGMDLLKSGTLRGLRARGSDPGDLDRPSGPVLPDGLDSPIEPGPGPPEPFSDADVKAPSLTQLPNESPTAVVNLSPTAVVNLSPTLTNLPSMGPNTSVGRSVSMMMPSSGKGKRRRSQRDSWKAQGVATPIPSGMSQASGLSMAEERVQVEETTLVQLKVSGVPTDYIEEFYEKFTALLFKFDLVGGPTRVVVSKRGNCRFFVRQIPAIMHFQDALTEKWPNLQCIVVKNSDNSFKTRPARTGWYNPWKAPRGGLNSSSLMREESYRNLAMSPRLERRPTRTRDVQISLPSEINVQVVGEREELLLPQSAQLQDLVTKLNNIGPLRGWSSVHSYTLSTDKRKALYLNEEEPMTMLRLYRAAGVVPPPIVVVALPKRNNRLASIVLQLQSDAEKWESTGLRAEFTQAWSKAKQRGEDKICEFCETYLVGFARDHIFGPGQGFKYLRIFTMFYTALIPSLLEVIEPDLRQLIVEASQRRDTSKELSLELTSLLGRLPGKGGAGELKRLARPRGGAHSAMNFGTPKANQSFGKVPKDELSIDSVNI